MRFFVPLLALFASLLYTPRVLCAPLPSEAFPSEMRIYFSDEGQRTRFDDSDTTGRATLCEDLLKHEANRQRKMNILNCLLTYSQSSRRFDKGLDLCQEALRDPVLSEKDRDSLRQTVVAYWGLRALNAPTESEFLRLREEGVRKGQEMIAQAKAQSEPVAGIEKQMEDFLSMKRLRQNAYDATGQFVPGGVPLQSSGSDAMVTSGTARNSGTDSRR